MRWRSRPPTPEPEPAHSQSPNHDLESVINAEAGGTGESRPSVLIADDDPVTRSTLFSQLEGAFQVVAVAENAAEAAELAEQHQPDVALIDVQMPEGGAREAVPQITARSPGTCTVILSADMTREGVLELIKAGAMAYVRKPVTGTEITKALQDALQAKAARTPA
jgi:DNA-binding NarL/FixJ family response regulator